MTRTDLENFKYLKQRLQEKLDDYEEKFNKITKLTATIDGMPKGFNKPNYAVEELIDSSMEIINIYNEELKKEKGILLQLEELKAIDERYYNVLYFRYVRGYDMSEIAVKMNYSYYPICRLNGTALNEFDKLDKQKIAHKGKTEQI